MGVMADICEENRVTLKPSAAVGLRYVGLEQITSEWGEIIEDAIAPEAPKSTTFAFDQTHVLYGKLRPYLNKVALPSFAGCCSTELIPIKPKAGFSREYLWYALRRPSLVKAAMAKNTGSRMPRADMGIVMEFPTPTPTATEQRRIVDVLSRAEGIVRLRREAEKKAAELIPAIFLDLFGDPMSNPKGWPIYSLGDLITEGPQNGLYKPSGDYGDGVPILRIDGFYDGRVSDISSLKRLRATAEEVKKFGLKAQDIVINRVNSIEYLGKSAIVPRLSEDTVFESNMMRLAVDHERLLPEMLIEHLQTRFARQHFLSKAKRAINQASINQQDVRSLPVVLPPMVLQRRFVQRVEMITSIKNQQIAALKAAEDAFSALMTRTFKQ